MAARQEAVCNLKRLFSSSSFFSSFSSFFSSSSSPPRAAVLIPLTVRGGRLFTLMTLRSPQLRSGGGEVCFPGGKKDPEDGDEVATALREAREEVDLQPQHVQVVGSLAPVHTKSGLLVFPVVGFIDPSFRASPSPAEVSCVFLVPLDFFLGSEEHVTLGGGASGPPLHSFRYRDPDSGRRFHIWGLTAALALLVAAAALRRAPEFDPDFDPETFQKVLLSKL